MRCMACGAEMILVNAIEDHSMPVARFERAAPTCARYAMRQNNVSSSINPASKQKRQLLPLQHPMYQPPRLQI